VYLLSPLTKLNVEIHKGMLVYRAKGMEQKMYISTSKERFDEEKNGD
jgi:hypothetical protein